MRRTRRVDHNHGFIVVDRLGSPALLIQHPAQCMGICKLVLCPRWGLPARLLSEQLGDQRLCCVLDHMDTILRTYAMPDAISATPSAQNEQLTGADQNEQMLQPGAVWTLTFVCAGRSISHC